MLINVKNANDCWHFNIYKQDKFGAQLSSVSKKVFNLRASLIVEQYRIKVKISCKETHFSGIK